MAIKRGLGKGLNALLMLNEIDGDVKKIDINDIEPNLSQPRKVFNDKRIKDLASSIERYGILQPIVVQKEKGYYRIIAGERRWRAAKIAGLKDIPVIIKKANERENMEIALVENIQRENLNPIEEAIAYNDLIQKYNLTHDELAKILGKSRSVITNALRLLKLSDDVKEALEQSRISPAHARTLTAIEKEEIQNNILKLVLKENMTVRTLERYIRESFPKKMGRISKEKREELFLDVEKKLQDKLGTKVKIKSNRRDKGKIIIDYYSKDELERIIDFLLNNKKT